MSFHKIIAIDGPAASGKSTVARLLARRLRFVYVNTGAMYRAETWLALRHRVDPTDGVAVVALLKKFPLECGVANFESTLRVDGTDPSPYLSTPEVAANVSLIAALPAVRAVLVELQRAYIHEHNLVMEGRDIGTVVFPDTPYKAYIDASEEVRAQRRAAQGFRDNLAVRDRNDSTRAAAPLQIAQGAQVIDSTHLTIEEVVEEVVRKLGL